MPVTPPEPAIHLTVATLVVNQTRFLMVEEVIDGQIWINQPAGHVEPGEHPADSAIRETREETGYAIELTGFLGISTLITPNQSCYYRLTFIGRAIGEPGTEPLDTGILRALWLTADEIRALPNPRSPLVTQDIERFSRGEHFPLSMLAATIRTP